MINLINGYLFARDTEKQCMFNHSFNQIFANDLIILGNSSITSAVSLNFKCESTKDAGENNIYAFTFTPNFESTSGYVYVDYAFNGYTYSKFETHTPGIYKNGKPVLKAYLEHSLYPNGFVFSIEYPELNITYNILISLSSEGDYVSVDKLSSLTLDSISKKSS